MMDELYVLDRNIVARIKDYLGKCLAENKLETIEDMKAIDKKTNIISIIPAINESTLGKELNEADKKHFIVSTNEELKAISDFFKYAKVEINLFKSSDWSVEKYFESIVLDSYSLQDFIESKKIILKALQLYVEHKRKSQKIDHFELIKEFIFSFNDNERNKGPLLHCLVFLANAGHDNCFSHMFLGKNFSKKLKNNENYLDNRVYNVFMDITFSKYKEKLFAYGIKNQIFLKTADEALIEVMANISFKFKKSEYMENFREISYDVKIIDHQKAFEKISDNEYNYIFDICFNNNSNVFFYKEDLYRVVLIDDKELNFIVYKELEQIGNFKIIPEKSRYIINKFQPIDNFEEIVEKSVEIARLHSLKVVENNYNALKAFFLKLQY